MSELSRTRSFCLPMVAALALVGCDTQTGTAPQGEGQANSATTSGVHGEYRVDRSRAGEPLADTPVRAPDGTMRPLTSLMGRPVILNLWATWCAPCVVELPTLERLAGTHQEVAHVVLLSQDLGEAAVPTAFLAERNIRTPQNWHDPENAVGLAAGGNLPTTILYDREGKEVLRVIGPLDWAGRDASALLVEAGLPPNMPPPANP